MVSLRACRAFIPSCQPSVSQPEGPDALPAESFSSDSSGASQEISLPGTSAATCLKRKEGLPVFPNLARNHRKISFRNPAIWQQSM